jgi:hypothetical protein
MSDSHLIQANVCNGIPGQGQVHHLSDVPEAERLRTYGKAEITLPDPITAGESVDAIFRFMIGDTELGPGTGLRVAWRWPFDWGDPQTDDADAANYLSIETPDDIHIGARYERRGDLDPWHHDIDLRVTAGFLHRSDVVVVTVTNWEASTFATPDGAFVLLINPDGGDRWIRLVDPPSFTVAPGPPARLIAIAPGDGIIGESAVVRVRAIDAWDNATPIDAPILLGDGVDIGKPVRNERYPIWEFPVAWKTATIHRLSASSGNLFATANPTLVHTEPPPHRLYWGDVHGGQSEIGCGAGSLDHHYAYARDVAALQFTSQQANDHYVTSEIWQHVRDVTPRYDVPGEFLAYLGCEWSPPTVDGGDRNVLYLTDEPRMRRSGRFFTERNPDPEPDLPHAPEFLNAFRDQDVFLNLHVGGRPTNLEWHAPGIEPLFEIHSTHATSEWFIFDAIERGYKVGITAGTDGVMGRPGACGPGRRVTRNVRNGLTAVRAAGLEQRAVAEGFFARHCYGTTGARILLDVDIQGQPMGSVVTLRENPTIQVHVDGTAPIERVELLRDTEVIHTWEGATPDPNRLRLLWGGAKERGTAGAQQQVWDGSLQIENASLSDIKPVGLQGAVDRIQHGDHRVSWTTATAGNDMGFTFTATGRGNLKVTTEPATTFSVTLDQIRSSAHCVDAGGLGLRVEIGPAPSDVSPLSVNLSHTDDAPLDSEHAYWIRVTQTDRHRAWSSPIYVTVDREESDSYQSSGA